MDIKKARYIQRVILRASSDMSILFPDYLSNEKNNQLDELDSKLSKALRENLTNLAMDIIHPLEQKFPELKQEVLESLKETGNFPDIKDIE